MAFSNHLDEDDRIPYEDIFNFGKKGTYMCSGVENEYKENLGYVTEEIDELYPVYLQYKERLDKLEAKKEGLSKKLNELVAGGSVDEQHVSLEVSPEDDSITAVVVKEPANEIIEVPKKKSYLLMVEDIQMALMSRIFTGIQYVEVQGFNLKESPEHLLLVTPVKLLDQSPKAVPYC